MPRPLDRLLYVDDSGHPATGLIVFGWIQFHPDHWSATLGAWLELRRRLWRDYGIVVSHELHTTEYANGRGRASRRLPARYLSDGVPRWKAFGRDVAIECLETLTSLHGVSVGAVYRRADPSEFASTRSQCYKALVSMLEYELAVDDSLAIVFMDGDGSDLAYRRAHRELRLGTRRVVEDAVPVDSASSHLMQMADLVAWCANAAIDPHPGNTFAGTWYEDYLAPRDRRRSPQEV